MSDSLHESVLWSDKHAPKTLDRVIGNSSVVQRVRNWAEGWKRGERQKALLLTGPVGVGKTTLAVVVAEELGFELLEMNASQSRNAKSIERIAGVAAGSLSFSGKPRLLLLDEADGLFGSDDKGGAGAILTLIKEQKCALILTANDVWDQKLSSVRSACELLDLKRPNYLSISKLLADIARSERVQAPREVTDAIARNCSGDIRAAINDLYLLSLGSESLSTSDLSLLPKRDREETMFEAVRTVLKTQDFAIARQAFDDVDEDADFKLLWLVENVPREYKEPRDLHRAFEALSRADVFQGRIRNRQYWGFLRYVNDLSSAGIALSKEKTYSGFTPYGFPSFLRRMSQSKPDREMRKQVALKFARACHCSARSVVRDYFPMINELAANDGVEELAGWALRLELSEEELEFLGERFPKRVLDRAGELKIEEQRVKQKSSIIGMLGLTED